MSKLSDWDDAVQSGNMARNEDRTLPMPNPEKLVRLSDVLRVVEQWMEIRNDNGYGETIHEIKNLPTFQAEGEWLPYPKNKPEGEKGWFEVTRNSRNGNFVSLGRWYNRRWTGDIDVIAFRPLPAPYQKGE